MEFPSKAGAIPFDPPQAFAIVDSFLRFTQVSSLLAELTGYSIEELSHMGAQEIVSLESMEAALRSLDQIDQSGWTHHDVTIYRKDGLPVKTHVDTFRLNENQYLSCFNERCPRIAPQRHRIDTSTR